MFSQVIFAIDDGHELRERKLFLKYIDNLIAVGKVSHCSPCIGMYEGVLETCYMMREHEFLDHVLGSVYVGLQQCFLIVPGVSRQPCVLDWWTHRESMGAPLKQVSYDEAVTYKGWTFVESTQQYYVVGN